MIGRRILIMTESIILDAIINDLESKYDVHITLGYSRASIYRNGFYEIAFLTEEGMCWPTGRSLYKDGPPIVVFVPYEDPDFLEKIYRHMDKHSTPLMAGEENSNE